MSATNRGAIRRPQDLYPTPAAPIDSLLGVLNYSGTWWRFHEPCKGTGAIYDRVIGGRKTYDEISEGKDYLANVYPRHNFDMIITNPPFSLALEFLQKSLHEAITVCYLLRLNFLGSQKRRPFWQANRPSHVLVLANRPCFTSDGKTDSIEYAWFCWDRGGIVTLEPGVHVL
jgi:hypothetical protein